MVNVSKNNKIDTSSWKSFKLVDLFDFNLPKKELGQGDYWEVTGQTINNGRRGKVNKYNQENIFTIASVGAYCGTAFWHPYKFWLGNNVQGYKPKFKTTDNISLFLCTILTKSLRPKFSYGKTASIERVMSESIFLPEKEGQPDWLWIEEFMEGIKLKKEEIEASKPKYKKGKIDISSWKSFKLIDLFDFKIGSNNISKTGKFPQISASGINRGRTGLVDSAKFENCFTCAKDGQPGITFWHPYKFDINNHVTACIPKFKCSNNVGLFLEVIMTKSLIPKYNYGKALGINRIKNESIFLPEKDGQPDWEYMENFMNDLIVT